MEEDERYAQFDVMWAVTRYKNELPDIVATTRNLADEYVNHAWESAECKVEEVQVVRHLPEQRVLFQYEALLTHTTEELQNEFRHESMEYPGLGNGDMVKLDQMMSSVRRPTASGWWISATGWDKEKVEEAFQQRIEDARQMKQELRKRFAAYKHGTIVRDEIGRALVRSTHYGMPCWKHGRTVVHDFEVEPDQLTVIDIPKE